MKTNCLQKFVLTLLLFVSANFFYAQGISHENFPTKEEVFTKVKGSDEEETLLKQARTFRFLRNELSLIPEDGKSPKERELQKEYEDGIKITREKYDSEIESLESERKSRKYMIESDPNGDRELENFIINNLFDEKTKKDWNEREERIDARNAEYAGQLSDKSKDKTPLRIVGIVLIIIAIISAIILGKRRFNRTNEYGTQIYDSYWSMVSSNGFEYLLGGIILIGTILGALLLAF